MAAETDVLPAFILARYAERQAEAEAMTHDTADSQLYSCPASRTGPLGDLDWGEENCWCGLGKRKAAALRDITLKRGILALHPQFSGSVWCRTCDPGSVPFGDSDAWFPCKTVRLLGTEFTEHPGYLKEEWAA